MSHTNDMRLSNCRTQHILSCMFSLLNQSHIIFVRPVSWHSLGSMHFLFGKVTATFCPLLYRNVITFAIALSFRNDHGPVPTSPPNHTANEGVFITIEAERRKVSRRGYSACS